MAGSCQLTLPQDVARTLVFLLTLRGMTRQRDVLTRITRVSGIWGIARLLECSRGIVKVSCATCSPLDRTLTESR